MQGSAILAGKIAAVTEDILEYLLSGLLKSKIPGVANTATSIKKKLSEMVFSAINEAIFPYPEPNT